MVKKFSDGKNYKVIAVCFTKFKGYDQMRLMNVLNKNCEVHGIKLVYFSTATDLYDGGINDFGEAQIFYSFDVEKFDAVVIMTETFKNAEVPAIIVENCNKKKVPVISIDRQTKGATNINFTYGNTFEEICRHVVEHHKIKTVNFLAGYRNNAFSDERIESCRKVLAEFGLELPEERILYGDFWLGPTRLAMEEFIASGISMPDAFICANDVMALECMRTLKEHGLRIPEDVIVTGFDGIDLEKYYSPRLTTAAYLDEDLMKCIFKEVGIKEPGCRQHYVKYNVRLGGSCGCVPTSTENVEEQLYNIKFAGDDREEFIQFMYNMIAKLSNFPDLHYVFGLLADYTQKINQKEMWMCFNTTFMNENYDVHFAYNNMEQNYAKYTEKMRVPLHIRGDRVKTEEAFDQKELLPNMDEILTNNDYVMLVPIHLQGSTVGYMASAFEEDFRPTYFETFLLDFRHILEEYVSRSAIERLYVTDALTHIYNRHGFYRNIGDALKRSKKERIPFSIISIDMDGLKKINDTYGHAEGDFSLKKIADVMKEATNAEEICARFGGDEFTIAFTDARGDERAKEIVDSIMSQLEEFNATADKPYKIRASAGVYSAVCERSQKLDEFIKLADDLMYEQKMQHKKQAAVAAEGSILDLLTEEND